MNAGNLTIRTLKQSDFGYYECVVSNQIATIVSSTQLIVEGTVPHAPHNITASATPTEVLLQWLPGYSGTTLEQEYVIW